jgi:tetratricopeptide (TPR) repeat protein
MLSCSRLQLPPPSNWQDFESLCCDLWKNIWQDPNTQKNGRQGQPQNGVDIFGRPNQGTEWAGIQCKGRDSYSDKSLSEQEVLMEVEKAKSFTPKLSHFIIATTGPKDKKIQKLARQITEEHLKHKLFSVHIWAWEDIKNGLEDFQKVLNKHYPFFGLGSKAVESGIDDLNKTTKQILETVNILNDKSSFSVVFHAADGTQETPKSSADVLNSLSFTAPEYGKNLIKRDRLISLSSTILNEKSSIYIYAPSGYGKSILLSQIQKSDISAEKCWIDCERDYSTFDRFMYLINTFTIKQYDYQISADSPRELASMLNNIVGIKSDKRLHLLVDHVDKIDSGIQSFLHEIICQQDKVSVVFAGTNFKLKKQKKLEAGGLLRIIDHTKLAFNTEDIEIFFSEVELADRPGFPSTIYEDILAISGGWPIVLSLLREKIKKETHNIASIMHELQEIPQNELYDYLLEGYWNNFEDLFKSILLNTSIYTLFDRSDADAVLPDIDIGLHWSFLTHDFPFVIRISNALFMYQNMFKSFLHERLSREFSPAVIKRLHEMACDHFLSKGIPTAAYHHAKETKDSERIIKASHKMVEYLYELSAYPSLKNILEELSIDIRWSDPLFAVYQGRYFQYANDLHNAMKWYQRAEDIFTQEGNEYWKLGIINDIGSVLRQTNKVDEAISKYNQALDGINNDQPSIQFAEIVGNRGVCYLQKGLIEKAEADFEKATEIFELAKNTSALARSYLNMSSIALNKKNYKSADVLLKKALVIAEKYNIAEIAYLAATMLGQIYLEGQQFLNAFHFFKRGVDTALRAGYMHSTLPFSLNNYGVSAVFVEEPDEDGIVPLILALKMKKIKGLNISGTLQNLTTLLIRLGLFDKVKSYLIEMISAAEHEKKEETLLDALMRLKYYFRMKGKNDDRLLLAYHEFLENHPEKGLYQPSTEMLYHEGISRAALRKAKPILSESGALEVADNEGNQILIDIDGKIFQGKESVMLLCSEDIIESLTGEIILNSDNDSQNYLIEFTCDVNKLSDGDSQLISLWWVKKDSYCWVQAFLRKKSDAQDLIFEGAMGFLFQFDQKENQWIPAQHEANCTCGNVEQHKKLLYIANEIISIYKKQDKKFHSLTYSGRKYAIIPHVALQT